MIVTHYYCILVGNRIQIKDAAIPYNHGPKKRIRIRRETTERHHFGRRRRHAPASDHYVAQQAAVTGVRQADDLLSARGADVRRHPRLSDHYHAARPNGLPGSLGVW